MNEFTDMKALTLWQPYGTLLIENLKIYETRGWETKHRGYIAIHTAQKPTAKTLKELDEGSLEKILTALQERDVKLWALHYAELREKFMESELLPVGAVIGTAKLIACHRITEEFISKLTPRELALGDFTPGRFAWEFKDKRSMRPIPAKGGQGFWNVRIMHEDVFRI